MPHRNGTSGLGTSRPLRLAGTGNIDVIWLGVNQQQGQQQQVAGFKDDLAELSSFAILVEAIIDVSHSSAQGGLTSLR